MVFEGTLKLVSLTTYKLNLTTGELSPFQAILTIFESAIIINVFNQKK